TQVDGHVHHAGRSVDLSETATTGHRQVAGESESHKTCETEIEHGCAENGPGSAGHEEGPPHDHLDRGEQSDEIPMRGKACRPQRAGGRGRIDQLLHPGQEQEQHDRRDRTAMSGHRSHSTSTREGCRLSGGTWDIDRKSTRLNSSHVKISYAV